VATRAKIAANEKRKAMVERHRDRRDALRAGTKDSTLTLEQRQAAVRALARLPRLLPRAGPQP